MSLKDRIAADASVFLNPGEFAEGIVYTAEGSVPKTIQAMVVRYELSPTEENVYRSLKKQAEIFIARDEAIGIAVVNKKDDRVTLKDTEGIEQEARINDVISGDEGMWHLLVGW